MRSANLIFQTVNCWQATRGRVIWTEIGEAQITHTIFGRAKVRIIRKNDNHHRVLWLAGIVAVVIAAAVWQGLFTSQQSEPLQSTDLPPPVSAKEQVSAPAFQSENTASPVVPPAAMKESIAPAPVEIDKPALIPKNTPQPTQGLKNPEPKAERPVAMQQKPIAAQSKPVTPQPASKPQTVAIAPSNVSGSPANTQPPAKPLPPKPILAPAVSTLPVTQPAQSAASSPAAVIQLSSPLLEEDTSTLVPAGDKQAPALDSVQSK